MRAAAMYCTACLSSGFCDKSRNRSAFAYVNEFGQSIETEQEKRSHTSKPCSDKSEGRGLEPAIRCDRQEVQ